jgi:tRNA-dihydrouridine synthase B
LHYTKADAIMVGRAAMGRPWIFREIEHFFKTDQCLAPPLVEEIRRHLLEHLEEHYSFYGSFIGVRSARKHIGWYTKGLDQREPFWSRLCEIDEPRVQLKFVGDFLGDLASKMERWPSTHEVSELEEMQ